MAPPVYSQSFYSSNRNSMNNSNRRQYNYCMWIVLIICRSFSSIYTENCLMYVLQYVIILITEVRAIYKYINQKKKTCYIENFNLKSFPMKKRLWVMLMEPSPQICGRFYFKTNISSLSVLQFVRYKLKNIDMKIFHRTFSVKTTSLFFIIKFSSTFLLSIFFFTKFLF